MKVRSSMRVRLVACAVVAFVAALSAVSAQKRPDFSGRWIVVAPADSAGTEIVVKQTDALLTQAHDSEGGGHRLEYRLDGSEHKTTMASHGMDLVTLSRAVWQGDRLSITETTTYSPDRKLDQTMIWSIDEKGQLIIDLTATMTGRPTEKTRIVHKKVPPAGH
jgi:hypothetical protein